MYGQQQQPFGQAGYGQAPPPQQQQWQVAPPAAPFYGTSTYQHGPPQHQPAAFVAPSPPPPQAPAAAASPAHNPDAFAAWYRSQLAGLTFNSKPIITSLTITAHEHVQQMANVIARTIDEHIVQSHPSIRLPALYLLDSISKNIGAPYTTLWADQIARIFLETYRIVDQPIKQRMEELLNTWRNGGPGARPLFGDAAQWSIDRSIFGSQGYTGPAAPLPQAPTPTPPQHPRQYGGASPFPGAPVAGNLTPLANNYGGNSPMPGAAAADPLAAEKSNAIERIDRLLVLGAQEQQRNPAVHSVTRMSALKQLRSLLQTSSLSRLEVTQIQAQLTALGGGTAPAPVPAAPRAPAGNFADTLASLSKLGALGGNTPPVAHASAVPLAPTSANANAASDLMAKLLASGFALSKSPVPSSASISQDASYTQAILSLDMTLTSADLQKEPPVGALELVLHKHLPQQCPQCANRYPAGEKGQKTLDEHLDWHFRQNRKAKESATRGISRSWMEKLAHFIRGGHDDSPPERSDGLPASGGLTAAQEAELKAAAASFVIAPTDPGLATRPCPICKELFKSEWSEEEEEWIWRDAVKVDAVYFHATCRYSAKALSSVVVRGATPPVDGSEAGSNAGSRAGTPSLGTPLESGSGTPVNPVARIKEEALGAAGNSRKRKESPLVSDAADGEVKEEGAPAKRVASTPTA